MVLRTASSFVRSRTDMARVLPVTRRSVKKTTPPMTMMRSWMFPICLTKPAAKARSVSVLVSQEELAKRSSISLATAAASSGLSTCTTYQPTIPLPQLRRSSR